MMVDSKIPSKKFMNNLMNNNLNKKKYGMNID